MRIDDQNVALRVCATPPTPETKAARHRWRLKNPKRNKDILLLGNGPISS